MKLYAYRGEDLFRNDIRNAAALQLSCDYGCDREDFFQSRNKVFAPSILQGRRCLRQGEEFFKIATMGMGAVAAADRQIFGFIQELMKNTQGISLFEGKAISYINKELEKYNHAIGSISQYYLPVTPYKRVDTSSSGFNIKVYEYEEIHSKLYKHRNFSNAIMYEDKGNRRDVLAVCAVNNNTILGMAGASSDSERFWQIGVDVIPEYRQKGLATALVSKLTMEVFMHGAIPYYGTWPGNIASHNVARSCGYYPAWTEMFAVEIE